MEDLCFIIFDRIFDLDENESFDILPTILPTYLSSRTTKTIVHIFVLKPKIEHSHILIKIRKCQSSSIVVGASSFQIS